MMSTPTLHITVLEKDYALRFGYASLRQLGILWKTDDLQQVFNRLGKLGDLATGALSMEMLDTFGDMVLAAIMAHKDNEIIAIDSDDVVTALMQDTSIMQDVMQAYTSSLPQAGKKNPAPAVKRPKKKAARKKS